MKKFVDFMENWGKVTCPNCQAKNWIYLGHTDDQYGYVSQACECYGCNYRFWLGDESSFRDEFYSELEDRPLDEVLKECVHYDKGHEHPY